MKPIPIILSLMLMAVPLPGAERVVLCGWDEVYMLDPDAVPPAKTWSWRAQEHPEIAPGLAKAFGTTDECKPVDDGRRLLVSSSGGGCALLELPSGKPVWLARVRNAHSLELLPGGRILAASSVGGDQLVLFDQKTGDKIRWSTAFPSAHGLVWDAGRNLLYALGFQELRTYTLKDWDGENPSLELKASMALPDHDGHDLRAVPGSPDLIFSTHGHVWLFNRDQPAVRRHPELGDLAQVKGIDIHPVSGWVLLIQAADKTWWSDTFLLRHPEGRVKLEKGRLYKGRWISLP